MLQVMSSFPKYQFVIAGAPSLKYEVYKPYIDGTNVKIVFNQTQTLLQNATLALVTSGTATLEAALLNTPEIVCYKGNTISMLIAWIVIKVKYISLVNLIMGTEVVRELKQFDLTENKLVDQMQKLLPGSTHRDEMINQFSELNNVLGQPGSSKRIAKHMIEILKKS